MLKFPFKPCIPSGGKSVPDRPEWIHEIEHDGYRLIVQRDGKRVRLFTRNDHDWSDRFPLIAEAALRNRNASFVIDGEAVLLGVDGRSDFNGLTATAAVSSTTFWGRIMRGSVSTRFAVLSIQSSSASRRWARIVCRTGIANRP
jgi:ATP-dependent DNA ligase